MAISDTARDFWDRISPRERRIVVLAAIVAPLTIAVWLGLAIHDGLVAMDARNEKTRHALEVLDDLRARGTAVQLANQPDDLLKGMPNEPISLDPYLNKAAQKAGFTLKGTHQKPTQNRAGFITASVSCDLDPMSLDDLKTFLQAVETDSKYVAITKLTVKKSRSKPDKVEASLEVAAYASDAKKVDEGSGSAAGSGSAGSAGSAKGS